MTQPLDKAVTTRFSTEDYLRLQQEAERRGCAIADVIRKCWGHYQQQQQLHQVLVQMEQRQRKVTFEMLCTVVGLKTDERQQAHYHLPEPVILQAIAQQARNQGFALSDEQAEAVFSVCQSGLDIVQGAAGAGKSTAMQAMRLAYEAAGFTVRGATIARQAAHQLERETGIASTTLARLLTSLEGGKTSLQNTVVLVDEAGQLSSPDLLHLMQAVQQAGGKLTLVGEQQQLDAITHGGSLRYLSGRSGCARMDTIRRQRLPWAREAVRQFRAGEAMPALQAHQAHGLLDIADNAAQARSRLIQRWQQYSHAHPEKQTAILAQRWQEVKPLCDLVRQVYQALYFAFSTGERVRFTRNDYQREFTNGELGTITAIQPLDNDIRFTVRTDSGRTVSFTQSDYSDEHGRLHLVQAYASTVYSSQGSTIDGDTFVLYTTGMDRAATYVAGSRPKDNCHWFVNGEELDALSGQRDKGVTPDEATRLATLARCMGTDRHKCLASEYLNGQQATKQAEHRQEHVLAI